MSKAIFYKTGDSRNTINKSLIETGTKNINLLFSYNPVQFQCYIKGDDVLKNSNYASLLQKYYFVNLDSIGAGIYLVTFSLDVLETYKNIILASEFDITATGTAGKNTAIPVSDETFEKIFKSDKTVEFDNSIIVTTTGDTLE